MAGHIVVTAEGSTYALIVRQLEMGGGNTRPRILLNRSRSAEQILNSELSNLIQESKRKHADLRAAAEKSLEELKSLRTISEAQTAADLSHRPHFVTPFVIACGTKNAKFTGIAIVCLQRLVVSRALPRPRLKEVLEAFREATSAGLDVQLKILQALPSLLQNYGDDIKGDLLATALNICSTLQASKNGMVNNTAAATLQQLVVAVFDKVVAEDKMALEVPTVAEAPTENGTIQLRAAAFDAYRVFRDLCLLTESQKPQFLKVSGLPQTFGLELIESVLTNHAEIFLTHPEQANILRIRVMPFVINSLSEKQNFATTVRTARILYTLLRRHLSILVAEGEMALGLLNHMLDPDTPQWKRALCMEVFRGIFAENTLIRQIFALYDAQTGRKEVLADLVASFVRLSSEKPSVIGLGHQSTVPTGNSYATGNASTDQAMLDASGVAGIISSPIASSEANSGISTQWSSMRVPCIDQLDKTDPPAIPESYIYSLTLTCINSFSEGLAKFILPLTVPTDARSRRKTPRTSEAFGAEQMEKATINTLPDQPKIIERGGPSKRNPIPVNPLSLEDHPLHEDIEICAAIIDRCWPAILATCSTFLYAALDADYYHGLVRSFQKFTHVAGLLRLSTPRDAFLTTLGKAAVPPNVFTASSAPPPTPTTPSLDSQSLFSNARGLLSIDNLSSPTTERTRQLSVDIMPPSLNTRNLLCLRALLNLGIALGPTLDVAWLIILETLQQADFVLFSSSRGAGRSPVISQKPDGQAQGDSSALLVNFGTEIKAVETAASRLFESTIDFPNESFVDVVRALCNLFGRDESITPGDVPPTPIRPTSSNSSRKASHTHRRMNSISTSSPAQNQEDYFALAKLADVATINIDRLMASSPDVAGWSILTSELTSAATTATIASPVRLRAAEIIVRIVLEAAVATMSIPVEFRKDAQSRLLLTFRRAVEPLELKERDASASTSVTDIDVHKIVLEGFKNMLEHCGETLISGWDIAFDIIGSVFVYEKPPSGEVTRTRHSQSRSARLVRSSFSSLQLICSDFLSSLPSSCFLILVDTFYNFCTQDDDLNICLTTVTFFWVLSDFISNGSDSFALDPDLLNCDDEQALIEKASSGDNAVSNSALWMILLLRLTAVTTDDRLELRNSAIQTLLRIFDAYGDQLSPEAWSMCIQSIIFKMLSSVEDRMTIIAKSDSSTSIGEKIPWIETTVVVLSGVSGLIATYLRVLTSHESFRACWQALLDHYNILLGFGILDINTAVFKALGDILSGANNKAEEETKLDRDSIDLAWDLWSHGLPLASEDSTASNSNNQNCLTAYISSLKELYRILQAEIDLPRTERILVLLRDTVQLANVANYSADVEYLTTLQGQVLEALRIIRSDINGVPAAMIIQVAEFAALAFQQDLVRQTDKQRPTYIALSKASMALLESLTVAHATDSEVYTTSALSSSLVALSRPITLKYAFPVTTKSLAPWKQATTTALAILKATLPVISKQGIPENDVRPIWSSIVQIANGITAADCGALSPSVSIQEDQDFDIASFLALRELIIPALGTPLVPDKSRRAYTESLFYTSLIHAPEPQELPQLSQELLASLYQPRKGRTVDPAASLRSRMSYVCLDELVSLVSVHDSSPARIKLAQAAAPYLILRASLTLRAYIADQPLRGRMPQPLSQRKELVYILKALVNLDCEPEAIPDTPGVESEGKKHLHRLYPLLAKAVRAAARDQEVLEWLGKALDEVGAEFNV